MHNITATDNVFSVREPMWHGLGEVLPDYPTADEVRELAFDWEPISEPVYTRQPAIADDGSITYEYTEIPGKKAEVRSDNAFVLAVNNDSHETFGNSDTIELAKHIQGEHAKQ